MSGETIQRTGGNGRWSTCVAYGGVLYIGGVASADIHADTKGQARDIFSQIDKLLAHHQTDKRRLLSVDIYLKSIADYGDFNAVWDEWVVEGSEPARNLVGAELPIPEYRVALTATVALND